jgi:hypothetical protein
MQRHLPARLLRPLVLAYRRHEAWARRSGFAPMDWSEFKVSRMANPLARDGDCFPEKDDGVDYTNLA